MVARVSVDRRHVAFLNLSELVKGVRHRSKAVRGAGSCGDDRIFLRKGVFVYAVNDGRKVVTSGSGNNNFLSACFDVCFGFSFGAVEARAFQNNVYVVLSPRAVRSVFFSVDFNRLTFYGDRTCFVVSGNFVAVFVSALSGVILQKVSEHRGAGKVVDSNYFITFCVEHLSERKTTDTAETVDCNFYVCHN